MSTGVTEPFQATKAGIGKVVFPLLASGKPHKKIEHELSVPLHQEAGATEKS